MTKPRLKIIAPGIEFLLPYVERQLPDYDVTADEAVDCDVATYITDDPEAGFSDKAAQAPVLVCPNIVGTGMHGLPMEMAVRINRGTYFHIKDKSAKLSTVHATDVARAVALTLGRPGRYVVTDGTTPTYDDLAEAIAVRLGHKRIFTLKERWARFIMSSRLVDIVTTDNVVEPGEGEAVEGLVPTPVTEYLRTHVYDDESL